MNTLAGKLTRDLMWNSEFVNFIVDNDKEFKSIKKKLKRWKRKDEEVIKRRAAGANRRGERERANTLEREKNLEVEGKILLRFRSL